MLLVSALILPLVVPFAVAFLAMAFWKTWPQLAIAVATAALLYTWSDPYFHQDEDWVGPIVYMYIAVGLGVGALCSAAAVASESAGRPSQGWWARLAGFTGAVLLLYGLPLFWAVTRPGRAEAADAIPPLAYTVRPPTIPVAPRPDVDDACDLVTYRVEMRGLKLRLPRVAGLSLSVPDIDDRPLDVVRSRQAAALCRLAGTKRIRITALDLDLSPTRDRGDGEEPSALCQLKRDDDWWRRICQGTPAQRRLMPQNIQLTLKPRKQKVLPPFRLEEREDVLRNVKTWDDYGGPWRRARGRDFHYFIHINAPHYFAGCIGFHPTRRVMPCHSRNRITRSVRVEYRSEGEGLHDLGEIDLQAQAIVASLIDRPARRP